MYIKFNNIEKDIVRITTILNIKSEIGNKSSTEAEEE